MSTNRGAVARALCLAQLSLLPVAVQARPEVTVSFELAVPRWSSVFDRERAELEQRSAKATAAWLNQTVAFADFRAAASSPRHLRLVLEPVPGAETRLRMPTQLRLELRGPSAGAAAVGAFRPELDYSKPTGGIAAFVREIELRLPAIDRPQLMAGVLSRIPIADRAYLWKDPVGWVIPFRKAELCVDHGSQLRIDSMVPSGAGDVLREFKARVTTDFAPPRANAAAEPLRGRLFGELQPQQDGMADLTRARPEGVTVRAVYVLDYQPLHPCQGAVPPGSARLGEPAP